METTKESLEVIQYPENLAIKKAIASKGISLTHIAKTLQISRVYLSRVLNGRDKGGQIIKSLKEIAGVE